MMLLASRTPGGARGARRCEDDHPRWRMRAPAGEAQAAPRSRRARAARDRTHFRGQVFFLTHAHKHAHFHSSPAGRLRSSILVYRKLLARCNELFFRRPRDALLCDFFVPGVRDGVFSWRRRVSHNRSKLRCEFWLGDYAVASRDKGRSCRSYFESVTRLH